MRNFIAEDIRFGTRFNAASPNRGVVWRKHYLSTGNQELFACLPYYKYGDELYRIPIEKLDVFRCDMNPNDTPWRERGVLSESGDVLKY